ncbi:MAG: HK97 gp10 family phage protein [Thiolinea sp.]
MIELEISTHDFERVKQQIDALEAGIKKKANLAGLREIAKPLKASLQSTLPSLSGALRRSVGYKTLSKRRMSQVGIQDDDALEVGTTRKASDRSGKSRYQTYKMRFLEHGTGPHEIKARPGKFLKLRGGHFAKEVMHPGINGRGYLRKVYDQHQGHMQGLFVKGAQAVLAKHGVVLI